MQPVGTVQHTVRGALGVITLSNPTKLNAITAPMWQGLAPALQSLCAQPAVRAVALCGAGTDFGSGADLAELVAATASAAAAAAYCRMVAEALLAIARCPLPTWSLLQGACIGGAAEVALATDARVATPSTRFLLPFVRLGVVPDLFTMRRLAACVGHNQARNLLLEPQVVDAERCLRLGLVDSVEATELQWSRLEARAAALQALDAAAMSQIKTVMLEVPADDVEAMVASMVQSLTQGEVRARAQRALERIS